MKHKLGICIPYRDREEHLNTLIPHLTNHLNKQGIEHTFYVAHQVDDKLFNRGAMKNIAAQYAFNDGCDYIAWHDVDMLPNSGCDYSYPEETPIHIATKLSKYDYGMNYSQYFGGVVLFTKEQVEKINGYSNEYWDWGQEDDDLLWRCHFENYTTGRVIDELKNKRYCEFDGDNSFIEIPTNREISSCLHNDHTISILFYAEQQPEKVPIWLIGDDKKKFIEYPLLRKDGSWTWGLSFNNSRAVTSVLYDRDNRHIYNWAKRFENQWTWLTVSYKLDTDEFFLYVNDELTLNKNGVKSNEPAIILNKLRTHDSVRPFLLGFCNHIGTKFKGKISEVLIYNKSKQDISKFDEPVLHFNSIISEGIKFNNITFGDEDIKIIEDILPYRRIGEFECLPHADEGFVNGKWVKGETTARNEKRFVTEMQQGKIDYKKDGINSLKYVTKNVSYNDNITIIDVEL